MSCHDITLIHTALKYWNKFKPEKSIKMRSNPRLAKTDMCLEVRSRSKPNNIPGTQLVLAVEKTLAEEINSHFIGADRMNLI